MKLKDDHYRKLSLEALFNSSLDAIASFDADYRIVEANRAFIDLFGYCLSEIKGKRVDDVMNMGRPGSANEELTAAVLSGLAVEEEGVRYRKDSSPIEVLIKGIPVVINGKMAGGFAIYADIGERKRIEKLLWESEAKTRSILSTLPDLIFIFDLNGTYLDYHASHNDLLATEPHDFVGKNLFAVLPRDIAEPFYSKLTAAVKSGEVVTFEYPVQTIGGRKHFEARFNQIDEEHVLAVIRDITDRKIAEEELHIEQQRLKNVIEGSGVGSWEWDTQTGKTIYNENWGKIIGYTLDELQPHSLGVFESLVHPEDLARSDQIARRHLAGELPFYECELRMLHKEGHWVWVLDRGKVLTRDAEGKPLSMFGTHTDITERKKAEEQMRYLSLHDSLTGLHNRAFAEAELQRLDTARQLPFSIIMADLNGLKLINDTYGHTVGDLALRRVAEIIRSCCRRDDIYARWGGDEFVILLPQTAAEDAQLFCRRIIDSCRDVYAENVPVSMAIGLACKTTAQENIRRVLQEAEDSMYKQKLTESRSAKSALLKTLLKTLQAKSFETEAHTRGMQEMGQKLGRKINLLAAELSRLDLLITLHDIGKINIAEEILTKAEALTASEWETIKKHPEIGFRIARATEEFAHVAEDILAHHERWDGNGYPLGLKGAEIPFLARIAAIVDAYEVMTNGRPYKKALTNRQIVDEFKRCSGKQFDPELVEIFLTLISGRH